MTLQTLLSSLQAIILLVSAAMIEVFSIIKSHLKSPQRKTLITSSPLLNVLNASATNIKEIEPVDKKDYQINMEKLFHKNQLFPRIKSEFVNSEFNFRKHMLDNNIDSDFGFDLLVQMVLHKRASISVLTGILRKHFKHSPEASQKTADELLKCVQADLVDFSAPLRVFIVRFDISADVQQELDIYQYPLPMIIEPKELKSNEDTGYFTSRNSVILKHNNHHNDDVCLDHLNRVNKIKFKINYTTANMIQNKWRNLDKPKPGEERSEYNKRVKAFEKYDRTARDVMTHLAVADNEFYLTHKYDKRGRTYCQGYHCNYQGATWNKAVLEFAKQEIVN